MDNDKCQEAMSNDDKILLTASVLCNTNKDDQKGKHIKKKKVNLN